MPVVPVAAVRARRDTTPVAVPRRGESHPQGAVPRPGGSGNSSGEKPARPARQRQLEGPTWSQPSPPIDRSMDIDTEGAPPEPQHRTSPPQQENAMEVDEEGFASATSLLATATVMALSVGVVAGTCCARVVPPPPPIIVVNANATGGAVEARPEPERAQPLAEPLGGRRHEEPEPQAEAEAEPPPPAPPQFAGEPELPAAQRLQLWCDSRHPDATSHAYLYRHNPQPQVKVVPRGAKQMVLKQSPEACHHPPEAVTTQGSNQFARRLRCIACGHMLCGRP